MKQKQFIAMIGISLTTLCLNALAEPQLQQQSQGGAQNSLVPDGNMVIKGKTAAGNPQTTIIDSNGNLKIVDQNNPQAGRSPSSSTPPVGNQLAQPMQMQPLQNNQPQMLTPPPQNAPQQTLTPSSPQTMAGQPNPQLMGPQNPQQQVMAPPTPPVGIPNQMPQGAMKQGSPARDGIPPPNPQSMPTQVGTPQGGVAVPMPNQQGIPAQNVPAAPSSY